MNNNRCGNRFNQGHGDVAVCGQPNYGTENWQCGDCARAELLAVKRQLHDLAVSIHGRCYAQQSPVFEPFDHASGLVGQIDNMAAGVMNEMAAYKRMLVNACAELGSIGAALGLEMDADAEEMRGAIAEMLEEIKVLGNENVRFRKLPTCWAEVIQQSEENDDLLQRVLDLSNDAERYRFVSKLAWYVDAAAQAYNVCNVNAQWSDQRGHPDEDEVQAAIDKVRLGKEDPDEDEPS